jgi:hypothetical protein
MGCISVCYLLDVGGFNSSYVIVHVFVHVFKFVGVLFKFHELFFQRVQVIHCVRKGVDHGSRGATHLSDLVFEFFHFFHLLAHLLSFSFSLFLELFSSLNLTLSFLVLLLFFLNFKNTVVHLYQKMRQLRVYFIDKVAEIGGCFVVYSLEEHNRFKIFSKILNFVLTIKLSLKNFDNSLFLCIFDFFC